MKARGKPTWQHNFFFQSFQEEQDKQRKKQEEEWQERQQQKHPRLPGDGCYHDGGRPSRSSGGGNGGGDGDKGDVGGELRTKTVTRKWALEEAKVAAALHHQQYATIKLNWS